VAWNTLLLGLRARLIERYRRYAQRDVQIQEGLSERGAGAFLSGHDGWFFHRGLRETPDRRHR
jgi:hypothetical protein